MSDLKFSIITPSFNRAQYIENTIKSVLEQTYNHIEYIVIDGNSEDGTVKLLDKYKNAGKLWYMSEPDDGMYDAINKGFSVASGDILAYINTDDLYFPWTIKEVEKAFKKNPQIDLVFGDSVVIDHLNNYSQFNIYPTMWNTWLLNGAIIPQPTVFMRRRVFEKLNKFSIDTSLISDCEYWVRAIEAGFSMLKIHEFLATENNHDTTLRHQFSEQINQEKKLLINKYSKYNSPLFQTCIYRLKYFEKELLTIWFIIKNKLGIKKGRWENLLKNYKIAYTFTDYIKTKLIRNYKRTCSAKRIKQESI